MQPPPQLRRKHSVAGRLRRVDGGAPALRARMFAVSYGVDEAIEAAGYDDRSYDFGSALHEALTNSFCLTSWLRCQNAFPDDCLSNRDP